MKNSTPLPDRCGAVATGRRRRRTLIVVALAAASGIGLVGAGAPAEATTSNGAGAHVDTVMYCNPYAKTVIVEARKLRGYDWVRVAKASEYTGASQWITGWIRPSQLSSVGINPYAHGRMGIILQYADWTSNGWSYSTDFARRTDGRGYYC